MTVTAAPRPPRHEAPHDAEALEALIEEARRRARRRRQVYGASALVAAALGAGAFFGFGNGGGGGGLTVSEPSPQPAVQPPSPQTPVVAKNGALTILGGEGIATVLPSGDIRTFVRCDRSLRCGAFPISVDWAPDGRRVAYATNVGPAASADRLRFVALHVHDTATGRHLSRRLPCAATDLDWSPDGSRLAYACGGRISLIQADLGLPPQGLRTKVPGALSSPSWSPDGRTIVFSSQKRGFHAIYLASTAIRDRASALLARDGSAPAWSPDGSTIAYRSKCGGIKLITPTGKDVTPASVVLRCGAIGVRGVPVWSPDGRQIAVAQRPHCPGEFAWGPNCVRGGIYVMNANGSHLRRVTWETGTNFAGGGRPTWRPRPAGTR